MRLVYAIVFVVGFAAVAGRSPDLAVERPAGLARGLRRRLRALRRAMSVGAKKCTTLVTNSASAGPSAATCGSTIAGRQQFRSRPCAKTQRTCWRSRQTSSWPRRADCGGAAAGEPDRSDRLRDCHRSGRRGWSPASRGRAATPLALHVRVRHRRQVAGAAQGDFAGREAGAVLREPTVAGIGQLAAIRPQRRHSGWSCSRSTCATPASSSGRSPIRACSERRPDRALEPLAPARRRMASPAPHPGH